MELANYFAYAVGAFVGAVISRELGSYFRYLGWEQTGNFFRFCFCALIVVLFWAGWNIYTLS